MRVAAVVCIGQVCRSAGKPECISALTARACARSAASAGQALPPTFSFTYSTIASESQMCRSPSISTGTRCARNTARSCAKNSGVSSGSLISLNATP
jgi:hypothetical protein